MNYKLIHTIALILFAAFFYHGNAQAFQSRDSIKKKKFTVVFINKDAAFSDSTKQKMTAAFFKVYPTLVKRFNKSAARKVTFIIDPEYKGVAATSAGVIRYSPKWMKDKPEDIDVVTHEVMHVVQDYGKTPGPGWLTEGIADYVRYKYGVNNVAAKWTLPELTSQHRYTSSYRITARFLLWLEQRGYKDLINRLDKSMRMHNYSESIWREATGLTLDDLWGNYTKNPAVKTTYK